MIRKTVMLGLTLVAVLSAAAWVKSYRPAGGRAYVTTSSYYGYLITDGVIVLNWAPRPDIYAGDRSFLAEHKKIMPAVAQYYIEIVDQIYPPVVQLGSVSSVTKFAGGSYRKIGQIRLLAVPLWWPATLFGAYPLSSWLVRRRKVREARRRERERLCAACAYPLRGLPGPRCPECGTKFEDGEASSE